jgi:hypothetical protein
MWGVQLLRVNSYILYKTTHLLTWKKDKKTLLSQYSFRSQIVLSWLTGAQETTDEEASSNKRYKLCEDSSCSSHTIKAH